MTGLRLRSYTGTIRLGPLLRVLKLFMGILMQERMRRESIGILCLQNAHRAQTKSHRSTTGAHKPRTHLINILWSDIGETGDAQGVSANIRWQAVGN